MSISVGDTLPDVTLKTNGDNGPEDLGTGDFFKGRKVVLFAVPGAFTPGCSNTHMPGFVVSADTILEKADHIACMAVNDAFVMDAWGKDRGTGNNILMLADGNGDFTRAIDLGLDGSGFGLGARSQRYAMIVENGTVTALEVEDGPGLSVSSEENIVSKL